MKNILIDMLITGSLIIVFVITMLCLARSNINGTKHIKAKTKAIRVLFILSLITLLIGTFCIIIC